MFSLVFIRNCRPRSFTFIQHSLQTALCTSNMCSLRPLQKAVLNQSSKSSIQEKLRVLSQQVPAYSFHNTERVMRPYDSKNSHIKRILSNESKVKSMFEFFSLRSLISTPGPFMIYGLGGLIPFMSAPAYMYLTAEFNPFIAQAQLVYGACILSFLGGVSWGNHLNKSEGASLESLSYSILLPLVAWPAVLISPNAISFLILTGGIVYAGIKDTSTASYPKWFKNLRFLLSILVALSLTATLVSKYTLASKRDDD